MPYINDEVFNQGLNYADTNGTRIDICDAEPTTYALATTTNSLGNKTGLNTSITQAGSIDGRRVDVPAITDGSVTATGLATHWALTDGASILVATGTLLASQNVTNLNSFSLDAISITLRDAIVA